MTNLDRAPAKIVCHRRTRKNKDEKPFVPPVHWAKKPQPVDCPVVLLVILAGMALRVAVAEIASWGNSKTTNPVLNAKNLVRPKAKYQVWMENLAPNPTIECRRIATTINI